MWEVFGRDRIIYSSNWPVSNKVGPYGQAVKAARDLFTAKAAEHYLMEKLASSIQVEAARLID